MRIGWHGGWSIRKLVHILGGVVVGIVVLWSAVTLSAWYVGGMLVVGDTGLRQTANSAASKFDAAGLRVDSVVVAEWRWCLGSADGRFFSLWGADVALICDGAEDTVTHELAHNWIYDSTDSSLREQFLTHFDISNWNDLQVDWGSRGTEATAEVIVWGVDHDAPDWRVLTTLGGRSGYGEGWAILTQGSTNYLTLEERLGVERIRSKQRLADNYITNEDGCRRNCSSDWEELNLVADGGSRYQAHGGRKPGGGHSKGRSVDKERVIMGDGYLAAGAGGTSMVEQDRVRPDCSGVLWQETLGSTPQGSMYPLIVCGLSPLGQLISTQFEGWPDEIRREVLKSIEAGIIRGYQGSAGSQLLRTGAQ